jgi:hypothetical protein
METNIFCRKAAKRPVRRDDSEGKDWQMRKMRRHAGTGDTSPKAIELQWNEQSKQFGGIL